MKAKVLVADDSITIQKIVAMSFENEDIVVTSVNNGKLAFEKLSEVRPDVVLADTDMPGLTGYQLCQKIKESKEFKSIKVILLSSDFEDFSEDLYKSSNADGRLTKPFKSDEIIKKVNEMLHGAPVVDALEEPELLSLSATDILDDSDLPEAILLEEDAMVPTVQLSAMEMVEEEKNPYEQMLTDATAKTDDDIDFDHLFDESPGTAPAVTETPIMAVEPTGLDDDALLLNSMLDELEGLDFQSETPAIIQELKDDALPAHMGRPVAETSDIQTLDDMVKDLENLKNNDQEPALQIMADTQNAGEVEDSLLEISEPGVESMDELDMAFKRLQNSESVPVMENVAHYPEKEKVSGKRAMAGMPKEVELEPEDLLEKMAPSAFSRQNEWKPDLINESLAFLSESGSRKKNGREETPDYSTGGSPSLESLEGKYSLNLGDQINAILEKSLKSAIQREVVGLSDIITRTVREVVRDVAPRIAREIIKEEIEKIRDIENV